jgi:hypothetical protein
VAVLCTLLHGMAWHESVLLVKAVLLLVLYCIMLTKTFQLLHLPYLYFGKVEMESFHLASLHFCISEQEPCPPFPPVPLSRKE